MPVRTSGSDGDERLRRIAAVTDASLAHLDAEDLLVKMLDLVRDVLRTDTAAVLLLDHHSQHLVPTAARGLEEEVHRGIRLPLGRGFAGRVAAEKKPVIIERADHANVLNPILREKGIRSLLGVPMLAGGEVLGVLHVGTLATRRFTEDDVRLLQLAAERVSLAAQTRQAGLDRSATLALQRSLLPTTLPRVPRLDMAARYVPGKGLGVGGDWYDVFPLPSGWVGVAMGDVAGKGLSAAVVMGRLRSALRSYAIECDEPADVLTRLNRKVRHFEPGMMATALYAMIEPSLERVHISTAGHPPPVIATPGNKTVPVPVPADPPLGTRTARDRLTTAVDLEPGSLLLCYTDGLIERRTYTIDVGLQRLCEAFEPGPAEAACAAVMNTFFSIEPPADDVAVLAVRRLAA